MSPRNEPGSPLSNKVRVLAAPGPSRSIVVSAPDRAALGYSTGTYYLCFYAYTQFSARISTTEEKFDRRIDVEDGQVITQRVAGGGYYYVRYTNTGFENSGTVKVTVEAQGLESGEAPPLIYYKVCGERWDACEMSKEEATGLLNVTSTGEPSTEGIRTAEIKHKPSDCPIPGACTYLFSVQNQHSKIKTISVAIEATFDEPSEVVLDKVYQNIVGHGQFLRYVVDPSRNAKVQPYLSKLKIKLYSMLGDADLFVSFTTTAPDIENHRFKSRRNTLIDEVTIEEQGGEIMLDRRIYFSVFGASNAQV